MDNKTDKRVYKTKKAIRSALFRLVSQKDPVQITVAELAAEAEIERKTFYSHYNGIYEVIAELERDLFGELEEALMTIKGGDILENPYVLLEKIMLVINSDMDFYGFLLRSGSRSGMYIKVKSVVKNKLSEAIKEKYTLPENMVDMVSEYTISGMFSVYSSWLDSDRNFPIEDVSNVLSVVCANGIKGLEKNNNLNNYK